MRPAPLPRFVVLLRGVNVGKGPRVPMAEFKRLLLGLGCTDVTTVLNSGNAVFCSPGRSTARHAAAIAAALQQALGVELRVIVKSAAEVAAIVGACPVALVPEHPATLLVAFAAEAQALQALVPLQALAQAPERFVVSPVAAYLACPGGVLHSAVGKALLGRAGQQVTTRNGATVLKLAALL